MSDATLDMMIAQVPTTIVAVATLITSISAILYARSANIRANEKLDVIHDLTNSTLTKANAKIENLEIKVAQMHAAAQGGKD